MMNVITKENLITTLDGMVVKNKVNFSSIRIENQILSAISDFTNYANNTGLAFPIFCDVLKEAAKKYNYQIGIVNVHITISFTTSNSTMLIATYPNEVGIFCKYQIIKRNDDQTNSVNNVYSAPGIASISIKISSMELDAILRAQSQSNLEHKKLEQEVTIENVLNSIRNYIIYADYMHIPYTRVIDALTNYIGGSQLATINVSGAFIHISVMDIKRTSIIIKCIKVYSNNNEEIDYYDIENEISGQKVNMGMPSLFTTPATPSLPNTLFTFNKDESLKDIANTLKSIDQNVAKLVNSQYTQRETIKLPIGVDFNIGSFGETPNRPTIKTTDMKCMHAIAAFDTVLTIIKKTHHNNLINIHSQEYKNLVNAIDNYIEIVTDYLNTFTSQEAFDYLINKLAKSIQDYGLENILGSKNTQDLIAIMETILYIDSQFSDHFVLALSGINTPTYDYSYKSTMNCDSRCIIRLKSDNSIVAKIQYMDNEDCDLFDEESENEEVEKEENFDIADNVCQLLNDIRKYINEDPTNNIDNIKNRFLNRFFKIGYHIDLVNKNEHSMVYISIMYKCRDSKELKALIDKIKTLDYDMDNDVFNQILAVDPNTNAFLAQVLTNYNDDTYLFETEASNINTFYIKNIKTHKIHQIDLVLPKDVVDKSATNPKMYLLTEAQLQTLGVDTSKLTLYQALPVNLTYDWIRDRYRHISGSDPKLNCTEFLTEHSDMFSKLVMSTVLSKMLELTTDSSNDEYVPKKVDIQG